MAYCTLLILITYKQNIPSNTTLVSFKSLNDTIKLITNINTVNGTDTQMKAVIQISTTTLKYCGYLISGFHHALL